MQTLIEFAKSWIGVPYKWGGETRDGIDCSGLVQEILKSVGMAPPNDRTSQMLYEYFSTKGKSLSTPKPGALLFYGKEKITHIAFAIDEWRVVEAGGGDRHTLTREDAIHRNAWVRIRPYDHRSDLTAIIMPSYKRISQEPLT